MEKSNCYGVEALNEPSGDINRDHLVSFLQDTISQSRQAGLPMEVPMIIMDWTFQWSYYKGRWS